VLELDLNRVSLNYAILYILFAESGRSPFSKELEHLTDYKIPLLEKDSEIFIDQIIKIADQG